MSKKSNEAKATREFIDPLEMAQTARGAAAMPGVGAVMPIGLDPVSAIANAIGSGLNLVTAIVNYQNTKEMTHQLRLSIAAEKEQHVHRLELLKTQLDTLKQGHASKLEIMAKCKEGLDVLADELKKPKKNLMRQMLRLISPPGRCFKIDIRQP